MISSRDKELRVKSEWVREGRQVEKRKNNFKRFIKTISNKNKVKRRREKEELNQAREE